MHGISLKKRVVFKKVFDDLNNPIERIVGITGEPQTRPDHRINC